jgi:hypothetical protein
MSCRDIGTCRNAGTTAREIPVLTSSKIVRLGHKAERQFWTVSRKRGGRQVLLEHRQGVDAADHRVTQCFLRGHDAVRGRLNIIQAMKDSGRAGMYIAVDPYLLRTRNGDG